LGIELAKKTIEIIEYFNPKYWFIENPEGMLKKMGFMQDLNISTIWYCKFGDDRAKPTNIWYNILPQGMEMKCCRPYRYDKNGDIINKHCHHAPARRGAKTGTQGLANAKERSRIPHEFCLLMVKAIRDEWGKPRSRGLLDWL